MNKLDELIAEIVDLSGPAKRYDEFGIYSQAIDDVLLLINPLKYTHVLVSKEPDSQMIDALYGPFLSPSCDNGRVDAYKAMIGAANE